jgi:glycosyltransferase involved in cell wall biosynthesis
MTIVVPMRNEEANVAPMCAELRGHGQRAAHYEVIIINDGTDRTADELNKATQDDPRFTVVDFTDPSGNRRHYPRL